MRHNNKTNALGRTASHRKAMISNMANSLVKHKRIKTTVAKARVLRRFIEPIITKAKNDTTHSRRLAFKYFQDKVAVTELFRIVMPKVGQREGGYTRILKTGHRIGDNAEMCIIELVDFNITYNLKDGKKTASKRRSRRGTGTKKAETETVVVDNNIEEVKKNVEQTSEIVEETKEEVKNDIEETKEETKE